MLQRAAFALLLAVFQLGNNGFAPANNPKFVMLVRFTEPSSSVFGSETAAPTFFSISKEIFNYFGISPTEK